ncbi:MAG: hypothetical protein EAZ91_05330 [Cytophagales bacterium]|nr:MAG: hypothetical protein EAZ91_05330 [Cytophagales bacterium]
MRIQFGFLLILCLTLNSIQVWGQSDETDSLLVVQQVNLSGNIRTRDRIVTRELEIRVGDTIRMSDLSGKLAWDARKLNNTNLFVTASVTARSLVDSLIVRGDYAPIAVDVVMKERWYLLAYPVFDLADRNINEWWYDRGRSLKRVIYGARLDYRNVTGNNDRLAGIAEFGFLNRYFLSYTRPYIDRAQRLGIRVDGLYQTNPELAYRSQADKLVFLRSDGVLRERGFGGVTLTRRDGFYQFQSLGLRYVSNRIADTVARLNPLFYGDGRTRQRYLQLSYGYRYDRRDNVAYPLRGYLITGDATWYGLLPRDDLRQLELVVSAARFWALSEKPTGRWFANTGVRAQVILPRWQPYNDLRGLGYNQEMVRGYELFIIDGQHFGLWKNSLRYRLFDTVKQIRWLRVKQFNTFPIAAYLTGFADAGYVQSSIAQQFESRLANRLLLGTGVSLDVVTFYNLVGRFSATVNGQGKRGFYFNIAQEF